MESKEAFRKIHEQMDRAAHWVQFLLIKVSAPVMMVSDPLVAIVNYFILDLGEESFVLTEPMLLVLSNNFIRFQIQMVLSLY